MGNNKDDEVLDAEFRPCDDITAYEVALLIPYMTGVALTRGEFSCLTNAVPEIGRHLHIRNLYTSEW